MVFISVKSDQIKYSPLIYASPVLGFQRLIRCSSVLDIARQYVIMWYRVSDSRLRSTLTFAYLFFLSFRGIERILQGRQQMLKDRMADWALGEALAYGTLLKDGCMFVSREKM